MKSWVLLAVVTFLRIGRWIYDQCRQGCDGQKLSLVLLVVKDKSSSDPVVSLDALV